MAPLLLVWAALLPSTRAAAEHTALDAARVLAASPNAPIAAVSVLGQTHGRMSMLIPIIGGPGETSGPLLTLVPLLEVFGPNVPEDYWRGRAALEAGWRLLPGPTTLLEVSVALEHESDHVTNHAGLAPSPDGSLSEVKPPGATYNDVAARFSVALLEVFGGSLASSLIARWHFSSCNNIDAVFCYQGDIGDDAFELEADGVVDWTELGTTRPFLSVHGRRLFGRALLLSESSVAARVGVAYDRDYRGLWQVFMEGRHGTEIGPFRHRRRLDLGGGLAWSW
jgi:hypothetical protein